MTPAAESTSVTAAGQGPLTRPFQWGVFAGAGALLAVAIGMAIAKVTVILLMVAVAFVFAAALRRVVMELVARGMKRRHASMTVGFGSVAVAVGGAALVVPPVVEQSGQLIQSVPEWWSELQQQPWYVERTGQYEWAGNLIDAATSWLQSPERLADLSNGILGAGVLIGQLFAAAATILILTVYFVASFDHILAAVYRLAPATKRERVSHLGDQITDRVGGYVIGQTVVAACNGFFSFLMLTVLGVPYAAALAVVVAFCGLIPLVGATLGAVVVAIVALTQSPTIMFITIGYYVLYQQIENYVIVPRVMRRTARVPDAVTIVAAISGAILAGPMGVILAIPVAAALILILTEVFYPAQDAK